MLYIYFIPIYFDRIWAPGFLTRAPGFLKRAPGFLKAPDSGTPGFSETPISQSTDARNISLDEWARFVSIHKISPHE